MHLRILMLLVLVSGIALAVGFSVRTLNEQNVEGAKIAAVKNQNRNANTQVATAATATFYECTSHDYEGRVCDQTKPLGSPWSYISTYDRTGCGLVSGGGLSTKTTCKPVTDSSCNAPGTCQVGGLGCCDGATPVNFNYHWCASKKACPAISGQGLNCGATCSSNSNCASGLTCMDLSGTKRCWNAQMCPTDPVQRVRVQGKIVNCMGEPKAGVSVTMFSNTTRTALNTTVTDALGNYRITKKYNGGVPMFSLMAGKDSAATGTTNYFSRALAVPAFTSPYGVAFNCAVVNCNYRQAQVSVSPYRENYHVGWGWSEAQFKARVVHGTNPATGFDFKQINCE